MLTGKRYFFCSGITITATHSMLQVRLHQSHIHQFVITSPIRREGRPEACCHCTLPSITTTAKAASSACVQDVTTVSVRP